GAPAAFMAGARPGPGFLIQNSIISLADASGAARPGDTLNLPGARLDHNAYLLGDRTSYAADPRPVVLAGRPRPGVAPSPSDPLFNGGAANGLEFDQEGDPRAGSASIGPLAGAAL